MATAPTECSLPVPLWTGSLYPEPMVDLFAAAVPDHQPTGYDASEIEVLEGLEPVRRRPGMYIGGTDSRALHHLAAEVLDNAMDEAVAGHASRIEVHLDADGTLTISDNGRGIPVDPHPRFPDKSALEVVMTTLHSGGKFSGKSYQTSGGLHGVGVSVVNALSDHLEVEVARGRQLFRQRYSRGAPLGPLELVGPAPNRRGTRVSFRPDPQIFGTGARLSAERLWRLARSKAYLFSGVEIRWSCDPSLADGPVPQAQTFLFPGGLLDRLAEDMAGQATVTDQPFAGRAKTNGDLPAGEVEWAIAWSLTGDGAASWYCNTIPTPDGGTHEAGLRAALVKSLRAHAGLMGLKKGGEIAAEDALSGAVVMLSLFMPEPQFQSQTKDRLASPEAARMVETALRDRLDHWLAEDQDRARALLGHVLERLEERLARRAEREVKRKTATSKRNLRLPGKLTDCARQEPDGTELFIVEGDSAGGSAKQARNRDTQAILPIRGKILNVASAAAAKISANQEVADLALALGCGTRDRYDAERLRYERIIIMTDADVDGAHIRTLLLTFFFRHFRPIIEKGYLYIAQPPLYKVAVKKEERYLKDDLDLSAFLLERLSESAVITLSSSGAQLRGRELRDTIRRLERRLEHLERLEQRGWPTDLVKIMLRVNITRRQDVASEATMHALAEELALEGWEVSPLVQDEEHGTLALTVTHARNGRRRQVELGYGLVRTYEYTQLVELQKALGEFDHPPFHLALEGVSETVGSAEELVEKVYRAARQGLAIQRYKGLGEMNPEQLWSTTMNPDTRRLLQVRVEDAAEADELFSILMGDAVEPRRAFIEHNALEVVNLDV